MAYVLVACCALLHMTAIGSDIFFFHMVDALEILATQAFIYLLYPLIGWLADAVFSRYKFILFSFITMIVASTMMILAGLVILKYPNNVFLFTFSELSIMLICTGLGVFESTAIQFGMDQMPEASSRQLSSFIQWYYWSCNIGQVVVTFISLGIVAYYSECNVKVSSIGNATIMLRDIEPYYYYVTSTVVLFMAGLQLLSAIGGLCLLICSKKRFNIDQVHQEMHPLKLIFKVVQYAWKHKCPERRSAFTYWEEDIPPRIDLGKNKYGGPFTTEEVEDTKTFFNILLLLFTLIGFHLTGHGYSILDQLMRHQCPSHWVMIFLVDPMCVTFLTIAIGIPIYQVIKPCCQRFHPNMLKRMGLGLLCCLAKETIEIAIQGTLAVDQRGRNCTHLYEDNIFDSCYVLSSQVDVNGTCSAVNSNASSSYCFINDEPFVLLMIPHILQGLSFILVFMTALEFICAQAPLRLKGLLIGIWYAHLAVNYLIGIIEIYTTDKTVWQVFHYVKLMLVCLSLVVYFIVSRRYTYRLRDETVHEHFLAEQAYERGLYVSDNGQHQGYDVSDSIKIVKVMEELSSSYGGIN